MEEGAIIKLRLEANNQTLETSSVLDKCLPASDSGERANSELYINTESILSSSLGSCVSTICSLLHCSSLQSTIWCCKNLCIHWPPLAFKSSSELVTMNREWSRAGALYDHRLWTVTVTPPAGCCPPATSFIRETVQPPCQGAFLIYLGMIYLHLSEFLTWWSDLINFKF